MFLITSSNFSEKGMHGIRRHKGEMQELEKIGSPSGCQVSTRERAWNQMGFSTLKSNQDS